MSNFSVYREPAAAAPVATIRSVIFLPSTLSRYAPAATCLNTNSQTWASVPKATDQCGGEPQVLG
jgi:hypothetical protein